QPFVQSAHPLHWLPTAYRDVAFQEDPLAYMRHREGGWILITHRPSERDEPPNVISVIVGEDDVRHVRQNRLSTRERCSVRSQAARRYRTGSDARPPPRAPRSPTLLSRRYLPASSTAPSRQRTGPGAAARSRCLPSWLSDREYQLPV